MHYGAMRGKVSLVNLSVWRCSVPRLRARCAFLWDAILILENLLDKALKYGQ